MPGNASSPQLQSCKHSARSLWGKKRVSRLKADSIINDELNLSEYCIHSRFSKQSRSVSRLRKRVTLYTTAPYILELGTQIDPLQRLGPYGKKYQKMHSSCKLVGHLDQSAAVVVYSLHEWSWQGAASPIEVPLESEAGSTLPEQAWRLESKRGSQLD